MLHYVMLHYFHIKLIDVALFNDTPSMLPYNNVAVCDDLNKSTLDLLNISARMYEKMK